MSFGPYEMIIIAVVALLLFGKRLPTAMRSVGESISEFKKGISTATDDATK
ncbi:Sec-independent protein translocase subunit TatA/TatB [Symmachiella dynata]|uniref:Sec-independent protein translocase protein TatA n=1 Tax=Symmachiella dynata TaxID=2527995 RepID=A0A517ZIF1_9PLAN|nr:twin-arginine translocase TatA/TatE family subunit [Symmachiella dynata]QDT46737.1 twin arginine translocase protein A [Symmachiella dynata]QDU42248.1 twin arginine translocase protein A [Symmachiella dynata]|tara:strand:+ start:826 stop:978 length:153 start_codon:yes stop_codon:yes gene_type:complete